VAGHDLEILMPRATVSVLVLNPRVREPDVPIVVRQLVFPSPPCNLFRRTIRPAIAVLLAAIALVEKSLILALQLVVEDDAPDPAASASQSLLRALVGAIDLTVSAAEPPATAAVAARLPSGSPSLDAAVEAMSARSPTALAASQGRTGASASSDPSAAP
jgi:hypothetical protein